MGHVRDGKSAIFDVDRTSGARWVVKGRGA